MGNCGSPSFHQEGECHERAVLIGRIRLIQGYVLRGDPVPLSGYYEKPFPLYRVLLYVHFVIAGPAGRAVWGLVLRPLDSWDCWFESRRVHGCLSLVRVVCYAGRGLCDGPFPCQRESYCLWCCVIECDQVQHHPLQPVMGRYKEQGGKKTMAC